MQHYRQYEVTTSAELDIIEFISTGKKGNIDKIIIIEPTYNPLIFNLGFGDKITKIKDGKIILEFDDTVKSDNGDRDIILATVARAVYDYTYRYPYRWLIFAGSDQIRTRLYRMAITKNYAELSSDFFIFGVIFDNDMPISIHFDSITQVDGFLIKRR